MGVLLMAARFRTSGACDTGEAADCSRTYTIICNSGHTKITFGSGSEPWSAHLLGPPMAAMSHGIKVLGAGEFIAATFQALRLRKRDFQPML